jgi:hypothetical protein
MRRGRRRGEVKQEEVEDNGVVNTSVDEECYMTKVSPNRSHCMEPLRRRVCFIWGAAANGKDAYGSSTAFSM